MSNQILPRGWAFARLPDLIGVDGIFIDGDWIESKDQDPNGDVRLIQLADVGDGNYVDKSNRFLTQEKAIKLGCTFLRKGDVLIARMPDPLGRACIFPGDHKLAVTVVDVCVVRSQTDHFSNKWLMYFVNVPAFREAINALQSGSTRKRISRGNLATLRLPVPPYVEQIRIVEKLEELFSDLDAGVAELKVAQKKLAQYQQSLLKTAIEGGLTIDWRMKNKVQESGSQLLSRIFIERRQHWEEKQLAKFKEQGRTPPKGWKAKYPEPVNPDSTNLPELPEGWAWASVDQCSAYEDASITDGPFGSNLKSAHYTESGPRVIRLKNIGEGVFVNAKAHISEVHYQSLKKHAIEADDVVVAMLGEDLPRACLIPEGIAPGIVKADCARIRVNRDALLPAFLDACMNSQNTKRRVSSLIKGIGRPRINLSHIRGICIPIPSLAEQTQIVSVITVAFDEVSQQLDAVQHSLKQSSVQRKNILKSAFSGQLVPQDPNDEPACVLLERIKAERAAKEADAKPRQRKSKPDNKDSK